MLKKLAAVTGGVLLGLAIAFARAGAFPFWDSGEKQGKPGSNPPAASAVAAPRTAAPAYHPEPNERTGVLTSFAPLVKRVMPTVVNVSVVQDVKASLPLGPGEGEEGEEVPPSPGPQGDPFEQFRRFFGQGPREFRQRGLGSGVIISPDGYILTNNHVVGGADEINVKLMDKREYKAKVVGKDPKTDLALIKIDTKEALPVAALGVSNTAEVGDWVVAIGNPYGFDLTVTAGIISAKGRALGGNYDDFIQTDASINPGNSGGPLFDINGRVIGINTAIYSRTGSNAGIGFAIPIDIARDVMDQLKSNGRVVRGWLGVQIQEVTPELAQSFGLTKPEGALVAGVEKGGPAAKSGIDRGDVIVKFDGRDVKDQHSLPALVASTPINKKVPVEIIRSGKRLTVEAKVGALKEEQVALAKTEEPGGSWGMQVGEITPEVQRQFRLQSNKGVVVRRVAPGSSAADAGLQPGDVVLEVNKSKISSVKEFVAQAKQAKGESKPSLLLVQRGTATLYTVIKPSG